MTGRATDTEIQKLLGTRLEHYRLAVEAGFFNEGPATTVYKGYQIMPDGEKYLVMHHGEMLTSVQTQRIAKIWITCRVNNLCLVDANAVVQDENSG